MPSMSGGIPDSSSSPTSTDIFNRLVRTFSSKGSSSTPDLSTTLSAELTPDNKKTSVADRLKNLGKDIGKLGKNSSKPSSSKSSPGGSHAVSISAPSSRPTSPPPVLLDPPSKLPHRFNRLNSNAQHVQDLSLISEEPVSFPTVFTSPSEPTTPPSEQVPTPTFIARKIQSLIDALPLPSSPSKPSKVKRDKDGRPLPPAGANHLNDDELVQLLSSATVMNGAKLGGRSGGTAERERRQSVWSVLEGFSGTGHWDGKGGVGTGEGEDDESTGSGNNGQGDGDSTVYVDDNSSVMVYSPLQPSKEDLVELAESVPVMLEQPDGELQAGEREKSEVQVWGGWMNMQWWPFSAWYGEAQPPVLAGKEGEEPEGHDKNVQTENLPGSPSPSTPRSPRLRTLQPAVKKVYIPSRTKLSIQSLWWGYRLYLPPPVMDILSDKELEAAKRTAMITTALTWFFAHLPINALPAPIRPALLLLQTIAPYLGYIGTFISWSWSTIKSYDVGYGIILTATWLMPVALIPGTWHENDFPKSPNAFSPMPLPYELPRRNDFSEKGFSASYEAKYSIRNQTSSADAGPSSAGAGSSSPEVSTPTTPHDTPSSPTAKSPKSPASIPLPLSPIRSPSIPTIQLPPSPPISHYQTFPPALSPLTLTPGVTPPTSSPSSSPTLVPLTPSSSSSPSRRSTPIPPIPPPTPTQLPIPPPVSPNSSLVPLLLQSPVIPTIPLPDVGDDNISGEGGTGEDDMRSNNAKKERLLNLPNLRWKSKRTHSQEGVSTRKTQPR